MKTIIDAAFTPDIRCKVRGSTVLSVEPVTPAGEAWLFAQSRKLIYLDYDEAFAGANDLTIESVEL